ncbi:MAG: hypothetical protein OXR05_04995 [Gemmatimonadota bacterium]|nr:hypothetical protein [Gemmatimonadota bacterium]
MLRSVPAGVFRSPAVRAATSTRSGTRSAMANTPDALPASEPVALCVCSDAAPVRRAGAVVGISSRMTLMTPPSALPP